MDHLEQENQALREEVTSMKDEIERLTIMMTDILAAQAQAQASIPQLTNTSLVQLTSNVHTSTPQFTMSEGYAWGMPLHVFSEGFRPVFSEIQASIAQQAALVPPLVLSFPQATMTYSTPLVHTIQQNQGPIFRTETVEPFDKVDDLQDKYNEMQREMRALRGKELFGQSAHELCLVPNVIIPNKFKVHDFEKYKGSTCPRAHLVMYARKMSTQTDNDKLLIHYFQDSLTGAALRWYMDLDSTDVRTFNDLANAFIRQYSYNSYLAPDRDELRALTQKERVFQRVCTAVERTCCINPSTFGGERVDQAVSQHSQPILLQEDGRQRGKQVYRDGSNGNASRGRSPRRTFGEWECPG